MKSVPSALATHLQGSSLTLATCWKVTRTDGQIFGFTDHDEDIPFSGVTYKASTGYTGSSVQTSASLAVDNLEVSSFLDSTAITAADLLAGRWNHASVEIFVVNYASPADGALQVKSGHIGEVRVSGLGFSAELRGLMQGMEQVIVEVYTPTCRADLFDARCKLNDSTFVVASAVTSVTSNAIFSDSTLTQPDDYFGAGKVTWITGANAGLRMEVKAWTNASKTFELMLPMVYPIAVGDGYAAWAGCRKRFAEDCVAKFANAVNFRGEQHVPGLDAMFRR